MKKYLLMSALVLPMLSFAQWSKVGNTTKQVKAEFASLKEKQLFSLDKALLKSKLQNAPQKFSGQNGVEILMPNANGVLERFQVWEYSNFTPELQAMFPDIRSYMGVGITNPTAYIRFSISDLGLSSTTFGAEKSSFIEAYTAGNDVYAAYSSASRILDQKDEFICSTMDEIIEGGQGEVASSNKSNNQVFKTFRLAVSAQAEYSQYHITRAGAESATDDEKKAVVLAAINNTVTRVNALYEKDLAVHFNLIDILPIIYLNPNTDPYTGNFNSQLQATLNNTLLVGPANYDIGHLLAYASPNGNAGCIGCICTNSSKGSGFTSHYIPVSDIFDIDYVAHEIGHQVGANHTHTYAGSEGSGVQVEVGSGNTIMAYTGITGNYDTQFNSNDFFTYRNILQIQNNLANKACAVNTPITNTPPVVNAGPDVTIPISTPFVLKGTVTDAENDALTYVWEQNNSASGSAQFGTGSYASPTKTGGPNFKMFPPTEEPVRYFPEYGKVLAGVNATRWEALSSVGRVLDFTLTARDNSPEGPQTQTDAMRITVSAAAGPFIVTAPTFGESLISNETYNVKWNVAGTNVAPVNTANVNIKLSLDGGKTFTTLAANTANDGEESITIPASSQAANAYIMIEAVDNVYFAMSPSFVIDYTANGEVCTTYNYEGPAVDINDGTGSTGGPISSPQIMVPIDVQDSGVITKIRVKPTVEHPRVSQIVVGIQGPLGQSAWLWNKKCNTSGLTATFSDEGAAYVCASPVAGTVKPDESLSIFKGNDTKGVWNLFASDNILNLTGKVTTWSLELCTREAQTLAVNEGAFNSNNIKVYPNPSNGNFFIKSKDLGGNAKVAIYDMNGRVVHTSGFNGLTGESTNEFNVNLTKGIYLLKVTSVKGNYTQKLIVK
ncbi:reprolysin-like metallopeptidase [Chryseobacterium sp. FH1]|uniref:reprolysin-like metallopeptidase n=1 Tax=Chryseobacterium sp. FH1 TaxID=1233951 RepID=UPI0009E0997B|nr:zinc-dependent metalloprotease family protein [Chryseobacterium sp. FH1]